MNRDIETEKPPPPSALLSASLRLIRAHRRMRAADVAQGMNMALRSYEHFEAGAGRINLERIHRFAQVTDSDPHAIIAALSLGSPAFALRCVDNKLATILMVVLQEFDEEVGDAVAELDARTIINTFTRALKELAGLAVIRDSHAEAWLDERRHRLVTPQTDDPRADEGSG